MPDLDDITDGKNFGSDHPADTSGVLLKGSNHLDWRMKNRLSRIFNPETGRIVRNRAAGVTVFPASGIRLPWQRRAQRPFANVSNQSFSVIAGAARGTRLLVTP